MEVTTSTQIRVQKDQDYWYIVEDTNIEISYYGCTISYWEFCKEEGDKRVQHITMEKEEALALASAIYKLFGDTK